MGLIYSTAHTKCRHKGRGELSGGEVFQASQRIFSRFIFFVFGGRGSGLNIETNESWHTLK